MINIPLIILLLFSSNIFAQSFKTLTFETQHEEKIQLNKQVKWVIFSASKSGSQILQESFRELKIHQKWLAENKVLYVADISGMPSLIASLFALPKMRGFPYPVALDREGDITQGWQQKGDVVTVYKLDRLNVIETVTLDSIETVNQFFSKNFSTVPLT